MIVPQNDDRIHTYLAASEWKAATLSVTIETVAQSGFSVPSILSANRAGRRTYRRFVLHLREREHYDDYNPRPGRAGPIDP